MNAKKTVWDVMASIVYMVLGVVLAMYPDRLIKAVCLGLGVITLIYGASRLIGYLTNKRGAGQSYIDLGIGVLMGGLGIVLIITPDLVVSVIPFIVGLIVVFTAVNKMQQAIELRDVHYDKWWLMMVAGILMVLLGGYLVINPFESATIMLRVVGIVLVINGFMSLFGTTFTGITIHRYKKNSTILGPGPDVSATDSDTGERIEADVIDTDGRIIR